MEVRKKLSGTENGLEIQTTAQETKQTLEKATGALPFSAEVQQKVYAISFSLMAA